MSSSSVRVLAQYALERVGRNEHLPLVEVVCDELAADGKSVDATNRNRHRRNAGEICCRREHVAQIHLVRIGLRAERKRRCGCGRREQEMNTAVERMSEIACDECAY